jgi:hypothetical protein
MQACPRILPGLLAGWLLLAPPAGDQTTPHGRQLFTDVPLSQWRQVQAFDSAAECEAKRTRMQDMGRWKDINPDAGEVSRAATEARCVPDSYIYPPAGPKPPGEPVESN